MNNEDTLTVDNRPVVLTINGGNLEVKIFSEDYLQCESWRFSHRTDTHTLRLDDYVTMIRKTKRHGFKVVNRWSRLMKQYSNIAEPITLDETMIVEVRQFYANSLVFRMDVN